MRFTTRNETRRKDYPHTATRGKFPKPPISKTLASTAIDRGSDLQRRSAR
jgi:hypothetical protein